MAFDLDNNLPGLDPNMMGGQANGALQDTNLFSTNAFSTKSKKIKELFNEPSNLTGWQLFGKAGIGLLIGGIIAALLFVVMTFIGGMFTGAITQQAGTTTYSNPMLSIILLFIGFLSTFIGNISVAGIYNLFFSKKYYDGAKIFGLLLLTNGILFFILAPIYFIFANQIQSLFVVLGFHIIFSIFISACQIEFSSNPNYSGSALMGNVIGFAASFLLYSIFYKASGIGGAEKQTYLLMLLPSILGYTLVPFGAGLREKIYYKFYENGNNSFYIPSPGEVEESKEDGEKGIQEDGEINIDS